MTTSAILASLLSALLGGMVSWFVNRKKQQAEVDNIATEVYKKAVEYLKAESDELRAEIRGNREHIARLEKTQEDCDERARVQNIELTVLRRWITTNKIETNQIRIFIADDDEYVRHSFKEKFERISVTQVQLFKSVDELEDWIDAKPEILILDYYLGRTIDHFMQKLLAMPDYFPKVIVISGMYKMQADKLPYRDRVTFVSKDEDFVNISVNAVMTFIEKGLK